MRFNVMALSVTAGVFWGAAILIVGVANLIWPGYGKAFLDLVSSVYPGYDAAPSFGDVMIGTIYGFVDGAIGGAIFGWLYNLVSHRVPARQA
ncbi:MAG: hypothetical protein FJY54_17425 [Betaproteobacteria bacterium]|nr:hypothetical protein [Betaproteobacteria bacterium]